MTFIIQQVHADQRPPECAVPVEALRQEVQATSPQCTVQRCWHCFLPASCTHPPTCLDLDCAMACEELPASIEADDEVNPSRRYCSRRLGLRSQAFYGAHSMQMKQHHRWSALHSGAVQDCSIVQPCTGTRQGTHCGMTPVCMRRLQQQQYY